jgi:hypothetical protein
MTIISTISPSVIFVCGCIPHDSADHAGRKAATNRDLRTAKCTRVGFLVHEVSYCSVFFERLVVDLLLAMPWVPVAELGLFMLGVLGPMSCLPYA